MLRSENNGSFHRHESSGIWPEVYKVILLSEAMRRFKPLVEDYNELIISLNVDLYIENYIMYLIGRISEKELTQFSKDIIFELSCIVCRKPVNLMLYKLYI